MSLDTRLPINADEGQLTAFGAFAEELAYAAVVEVIPQAVIKHSIKVAELTGAISVDATDVTGKKELDELVMAFETDASERIVTFDTNFASSGTVTIPANLSAIVKAVFVNGEYHIASREIAA